MTKERRADVAPSLRAVSAVLRSDVARIQRCFFVNITDDSRFRRVKISEILQAVSDPLLFTLSKGSFAA